MGVKGSSHVGYHEPGRVRCFFDIMRTNVYGLFLDLGCSLFILLLWISIYLICRFSILWYFPRLRPYLAYTQNICTVNRPSLPAFQTTGLDFSPSKADRERVMVREDTSILLQELAGLIVEVRSFEINGVATTITTVGN